MDDSEVIFRAHAVFQRGLVDVPAFFFGGFGTAMRRWLGGTPNGAVCPGNILSS